MGGLRFLNMLTIAVRGAVWGVKLGGISRAIRRGDPFGTV